MLIVSPSEAAAGQVLAAPVAQPHNPGQDLLKRGCLLDANVIRRLRDLGVGSIFVDFKGLEDLDRHLTAFCSPARKKVHDLIHAAFDMATRSNRFDFAFAPAYTAARDMITTLVQQGSGAVYLEVNPLQNPDHVRHSGAVTYLSLMLGLKLENYLIRQRHRLPVRHARDIANLAVASMFHDLGKAKLTPALAAFHGVNPPTDPQAYTDWQEHTRLSYDLIKPGVEPSAAAAVLHHHQAFDGSGFPHIVLPAGRVIKFESQRIHIFARILAAADIFDRVATTTDRTRRLTNLETLSIIRAQHANKIDGVILHAMHAICAPYLPGTCVKLSDGTRAVVIKVVDEDVFKPTVRRISADTKNLDGGDFDLRLNPGIVVAEAYGLVVDKYVATPDTMKAMLATDPNANTSTEIEALTGDDALLAYAPRTARISAA